MMARQKYDNFLNLPQPNTIIIQTELILQANSKIFSKFFPPQNLSDVRKKLFVP